MPAHRFARTLVLTQRLCGEVIRLRVSRLRPLQLTRFGGESPPPTSVVSTVCSGLGRPSTDCLAARREARPRCVPTDFCFPTASTTSTRASSVPSNSSKLSLRPWPTSLAARSQETGGPGISRCPIRFGGFAQVDTRRFMPSTPKRNLTSDTPVAAPRPRRLQISSRTEIL